jgi:hypothetical protein
LNNGYVVFKIKTNSNLVAGNRVNNEAKIYFDYNFPTTANTVSTTFQSLGLNKFGSFKNFSIFPNLATTISNSQNNFAANITSCSVFQFWVQFCKQN